MVIDLMNVEDDSDDYVDDDGALQFFSMEGSMTAEGA